MKWFILFTFMFSISTFGGDVNDFPFDDYCGERVLGCRYTKSELYEKVKKAVLGQLIRINHKDCRYRYVNSQEFDCLHRKFNPHEEETYTRYSFRFKNFEIGMAGPGTYYRFSKIFSPLSIWGHKNVENANAITISFEYEFERLNGALYRSATYDACDLVAYDRIFENFFTKKKYTKEELNSGKCSGGIHLYLF